MSNKNTSAMDYPDDRELGTRSAVDLSGSHRNLRERHIIKSGPARSLFTHPSENQHTSANPNQLCHSSSSIELLHALRDHSMPRRNDPRRASSSHGPISLTTPSSPAKINDSFFAMLQDYQPAVLGVKGTDQRSPGPTEFMQGRVMHATLFINQEPESGAATQPDPAPPNTKRARDPKVKNKLHRFLVQTKSKAEDNVPGLLSSSLLTKTNSISDDATAQCFTTTTHRTFMSSVDMEEQQRQRIFAHYDCQSLAANLSYRKLRGLINGKALAKNGPTLKTAETTSCDSGNKHPALERLGGTELLEHCTPFCSEVGGEIDHLVCLTGASPSKPNSLVHRPPNSYTVSILESLPSESLWRVGACPFQCDPCPIEAVDHGAHYYRRHFHTQKHENWFGIDEQLGPLAVSIKKEKLHDTNETEQRHQHPHYQFRMIIRTSELLTLRGTILEDSIQNSRSGKALTSKELLEYVAPEIQMSCLRLGVNTANCEEQLLKLDEQSLTSRYKVGILYCRSGQSTEEDMYNNEDAGPAFIEFLETIGKRVRLKGFQHYKAGLDNKTDSTGTHSIYTVYKECEIMFHVSTMLPFTPNNRQQLLRKRHIGNDIVTIVFQEPGALPFSPQNIRSQFQHVFLIVRAINPCTDNTTYRVAISRSKEVPVFGPPLPADALFSKSKMFAEFVLAKIINAENAAHLSDKFANLAARTRKEYLKDLCINYCTNMYLDAGNKFSIFPSKKKEKPKIRFSGDISQRGAICWQIMFQDHGSSIAVDCVLGISADTFVIIEEYSKQIIFVTPTRSILGWSTSDNALRIFYHNGECITINMRFYGELDEQLEVIERLRAVTLGNGVMELSIRRNMMGQLGFHVQPDGIVTQVDSTGQAWAAGMRRGYRLVEVCKIVVATLSYREMIDLLKTSAQLTFIVIKSFSDGTPRRGCFNKHCKLNFLSVESDNEGSRFSNGYPEPECMNVKSLLRNGAIQHPAPNYKRFYDQNLFPHKPASRIAHHTGSSTALANGLQEDYKPRLHHSGSSSAITNGQPEEYRANLPSSNSVSPQLCNSDKWYDVLEDVDQKQNTQHMTLSLQRQYTSRTFDHPRLEESTSLPVNLNTSPLSFSNCSSSQSSQQGDTMNYSRQSTDSSKLLSKHRGAKYEITEFKCLTISPNENGTADMSIRTHNHIPEQQKPFEEKASPLISVTSPYKSSMSSAAQKADLHGAVLPSTSSVKTAKLLPSITSFNQSSNTHRNISNYSRNSTLRRDLLELIGPTSTSSHYDSLKVKRIPTVDRVPPTQTQTTENGTSFLTSDLKQVGMQQTFEDANELVRNSFAAIRPATQLNFDHTGKSLSQEIPRINGSYSKIRDVSRRTVQDDITATPPLLPDAKKLDWTTLVDTATKAIVLQLRDDKTLSLCNTADDEKRETGSSLQEPSESYPLQFNCTPKLKNQLSDFITDF